MNSEKTTSRLLGAAFLLVFATSLLSGLLRGAVVGTGSMSEILVSISEHLATWRISTVVELGTSVGIVLLAVLLYVVLRKQNKIIALVALGWWLAEAVTLAVSKIGAFALIPLSLEFVEAGVPDPSSYQTLGNLLYHVVDRQGNDIHMLFYCLGGILWFYLFYRARNIPRVISIPGMAMESVALVGMVFLLLGASVSMWVFYPLLALELAVGLWLLIKGASAGSGVRQHVA